MSEQPSIGPTSAAVHGDLSRVPRADEEFHEAAKATRATFGAEVGPMREHWLPGFDVHTTFGAPISRRCGEAASLPEPAALGAPLGVLLRNRHSERTMAPGPIDAGAAASVLWAACGLQRPGGTTRTIPSGGALYPLDVYVWCTAVGDIADGLHQYDPFGRLLVRCRAPRHGRGRARPVPTTFVHRDVADDAAMIVVLVGVFARNRSKYGPRALRYTLIEAGHAAQNVLLCCEALGLAACPLGGFFDRELDGALGVDGVDESAVYAIAVGRTAAR